MDGEGTHQEFKMECFPKPLSISDRPFNSTGDFQQRGREGVLQEGL